MREKNRKPIASIKKLPQFTTMNVIDGQAGLISYFSLIFYSLTIDNILNIIVLLILAGVSISMLTGENGIITKATEAKDENEIATEKEEIKMAYAAAKTEKKDKIAEDVTEGELNTELGKMNSKGTASGSGTLTVTYENGHKYTINQETGEISGPIIEEVQGDKTVEDLVVGDKVYYDTGNINIGNEGIIECTVLYDKAYNESKGTNYGIQIISSDVIKNTQGIAETVLLGYGDPTVTGSSNFDKAKNSYNNAITTLNAKAEEYQNKIYALDARCVGSIPNNKNSESGFFVSEYEYMSSYTSFKDKDTNYVIDYNQMQEIGIELTNSRYWLASHSLLSKNSYTSFAVLAVHETTGKAVVDYLCSVFNFDAGEQARGNYSNTFRPVFTIKPEIKITNGDGRNIPYTLVAP